MTRRRPTRPSSSWSWTARSTSTGSSGPHFHEQLGRAARNARLLLGRDFARDGIHPALALRVHRRGARHAAHRALLRVRASTPTRLASTPRAKTRFFYRFVYRVTPQSVRTLVTYRAWSADLVPLTEPTLQDVVERQCERAGLDLALVDASELATRNVRSMVISQISSPRAVIEMLASAYFFSSVESEILRFSFRGADPVASIGYDELVAAEDDPLPIVKANDLELPVQVFVKYSNLNDNYQDGSEASDRLISSGQNTAQAELPLSFTPQEAKRIADGQLMDAAASALRFGPFGLTRDYAHSNRPMSSRSKMPPATSSAPGSRRRASPVASSPSKRLPTTPRRSPASRGRVPRATATAPVSRCRSTPKRCCSTSPSWPTRTTTRASTW
jgi:hypothetical protein